MYILYTVNSLTLVEKERSRVDVLVLQYRYNGKAKAPCSVWEAAERTGWCPHLWLLYEQPRCRAIHKMNTLKLCKVYRELLWMMGSLRGRQWCCSTNWINAQWRLAFWHCKDRRWQLESKRIKLDKFKLNNCSKQQRSLLTHRCQWICWPSALLPDFLSCSAWP